MAHHVARAILDLAAATDHAKDLETTLQCRSFKLELSANVLFAELAFAFDGCGMVHASLRPYENTAFSSMVVPESSLDFLGRPLLALRIAARSAEEVHKEVMAVVELAKAMQPAAQAE
uniref:Uncharacterized protein n=1 Tax=Tetradesmus obliquus TaxID=3088 RepID=A0A383WKK9_TETOB|eukprot:jgi/Sobl393_1/10545/SZX77773.1